MNVNFVHAFHLSDELPVLDNEMFHNVKPGLSAFADTPEIVSSPKLLHYCYITVTLQLHYSKGAFSSLEIYALLRPQHSTAYLAHTHTHTLTDGSERECCTLR